MAGKVIESLFIEGAEGKDNEAYALIQKLEGSVKMVKHSRVWASEVEEGVIVTIAGRKDEEKTNYFNGIAYDPGVYIYHDGKLESYNLDQHQRWELKPRRELRLSEGREVLSYRLPDGVIEIIPSDSSSEPKITYEKTQVGDFVRIVSNKPLDQLLTTGISDDIDARNVPKIGFLQVRGSHVKASSVDKLDLTGTVKIYGELGEADVFGASDLTAEDLVGTVRVHGPASTNLDPTRLISYAESIEQQRREQLTRIYQRKDTRTATVVIDTMSPEARLFIEGRTDTVVRHSEEGQIIVIGDRADEIR